MTVGSKKKKDQLHEAKALRLDHSKLLHHFGWESRLNLEEAINTSTDWLRAFIGNASMKEFTFKQIN